MVSCNCGCYEPVRTASERRRIALSGLSTNVPQPDSSISQDGGDAWFGNYSSCSEGGEICTCGIDTTAICRCSG